MLFHVLKKMINNGRMTLFLLTGFILAVALIGSIPIYTNGILQKTLTGDMETYQLDHDEYPGYYRVRRISSTLKTIKKSVPIRT